MAKNQKTLRRKRIQKRVRSKVAGTAEKPRLSVFKSSKHIYAQIISDDEGLTLASASTKSKDLQDQIAGKTGVEKAEIIGAVIAEKAKEAGVKTIVFDRNGYKFHGKLKAIADAARKGGLEF